VAIAVSLEQIATRQLDRETVRRGDGESGKAGNLGQRPLIAVGEGEQNCGDPAGHRLTGLGRVPCHWAPSSVVLFIHNRKKQT
jgi:hypothetical protein